MNKTELTEQLAKKTGMTKASAKRAVDALFSTAPREGIIANAVSKGDRVQITGFGTFERRIRKGRAYKHPLTGESIEVANKETIVFKPSDQLVIDTRTDAAPKARKPQGSSADDILFKG